MVSLQQELNTAKEELAREKDVAARRAREDEEELQALRDRCERLELERGTGGEVWNLNICLRCHSSRASRPIKISWTS